MTCERCSHAESKNCKILLFPTPDRHFDAKVKCPTGRASFWFKFLTVQSLTWVKCLGIARGRMAVLELTGTKAHPHCQNSPSSIETLKILWLVLNWVDFKAWENKAVNFYKVEIYFCFHRYKTEKLPIMESHVLSSISRNCWLCDQMPKVSMIEWS